MNNKNLALMLALLFCNTLVYSEMILDVDIDEEGEERPDRPVSGASIAPDGSGLDIIRFSNKDILHGQLVSFDPGRGVLWKSPEVQQEILFSAANVSSVTTGKQILYPARNAKVGLTNGDMLSGMLLSLDAGGLKLDTGYGGVITVNRNMVDTIIPESDAQDILFSGAGNIEDWKIDSRSGGRAAIEDGLIHMRGVSTIGRDMNIGEMASIDFSFESTGNCQFNVVFFAGDNPGMARNCYWLYISSGHAYLQRFGGGGSENLGSIQANELRSGNGRITLFLDRKNGKFTLMVNEAIAKQWVDPSKLEAPGSHVYFSNQTHGSLKIKDLRVGVWNGKIPGAGEAPENSEEDSVVFINGDQLSGKLVDISNSTARIKTEYAELTVPLKRIRHLRTASSGRHLARRNSGDARFMFPDGSVLTLDLKSIAEGRVHGSSENLGQVQLALDAFKSFELNIYREPARSE